MYLKHFGLEELPFSLTPNTQFFCELPSHHDALKALLFSIEHGEGFIKLIGEVGLGKTLLCRKILDCLAQPDIVTAYIPNPDLTPQELRLAFAREIGLHLDSATDQHQLQQKLTEQLIVIKQQEKRVVILIDEAQAMPDQTLETLRLLTNLETESDKLLQVILLAQPELDQRLEKSHLRQLQQRITFAHQLRHLNLEETQAYVVHRLYTAGYRTGSPLFSKKAMKLLYRYSQGVPRAINILAHKALLVTYGLGAHTINARAVAAAISDSSGVVKSLNTPPVRNRYYWLAGIVLVMIVMALISYDLLIHT